MALGVPLVATPVALEGIPHNAAAFVARTPEDFARALDSLTPEMLHAAAVRARKTVETQFSRAVFFDSVARLVHDVAA
jgi:hypothetical protein